MQLIVKQLIISPMNAGLKAETMATIESQQSIVNTMLADPKSSWKPWQSVGHKADFFARRVIRIYFNGRGLLHLKTANHGKTFYSCDAALVRQLTLRHWSVSLPPTIFGLY